MDEEFQVWFNTLLDMLEAHPLDDGVSLYFKELAEPTKGLLMSIFYSSKLSLTQGPAKLAA
jgi:hypothetical protein